MLFKEKKKVAWPNVKTVEATLFGESFFFFLSLFCNQVADPSTL